MLVIIKIIIWPNYKNNYTILTELLINCVKLKKKSKYAVSFSPLIGPEASTRRYLASVYVDFPSLVGGIKELLILIGSKSFEQLKNCSLVQVLNTIITLS